MQRTWNTRVWLLVSSFAALCMLCHTAIGNTLVYVPGWAQNPGTGPSQFDINALDLSNISHIAYAFALIDGTDYHLSYPYGNVDLVAGLKVKWPYLKVLLSIGGGGFSTSNWSAMSSSASNRALFVNSVTSNMRTYNFDGIDIDWEMPQGPDKANFVSLMSDLRAGMDTLGRPSRPLLTAALTGLVTEDHEGLDLPALGNLLDMFNIMTYTMHDPCYWESTTHFHTAWSDIQHEVGYYISNGVPAGKINLGLAFYGHVYTLVSPSNYRYPAPSVISYDCSTMQTVAYREILREKSMYGGGIFTDATERSAYYVRGTRWIGFDIQETLWAKIQGAQQMGLGGVMIWDASLDTPDQALLKSVASRHAPPARPCGDGYAVSTSCTNANDCCSPVGYCGTSTTHCGPGCLGGPCIQYPSPPPAPPSPPPSCGSGTIGSGLCPNENECCSSAGWCGTGDAWCGAGCKGGPCTSAPRPPPRPPSPAPPPSPPLAPPTPYGCGDGMIGNGTCYDATECCSGFGWCGTGPDYCGAGCAGGPCQQFPPPPPGALPPCGNGNVGSGECPYADYPCCSQYGYCGNTADHCSAGCAGGACWKPPSAQAPPLASPTPTLISSPPPRTSLPPPVKSAPPSPRPPLPRPPSPPPKQSPPPRTFPPPANTAKKFCGSGNIGNKTCAVSTECCSSAGWCGNGNAWCGDACVGGPCYRFPSPPPSPSPPPPNNLPCGSGHINSGKCTDASECCSAAGWCGNGDAWCGAGCQGGPCHAPTAGRKLQGCDA